MSKVPLFRVVAAFVVLAVLVPFMRGKTEWLQARTAHYEVFSSLDRESTLDTVRQLEDVRRCFGEVLGNTPRYPVRTLVFLCAGEREMKPFRDPQDKQMTSQTAVLILNDHDIPALVIRDRIENTRGRSLVYSSMANVMVDSLGTDTPFWFKVGFSEVFATLVVEKSGFVIGKADSGIVDTVRRAKEVSLSAMLGVSANSPAYRDEDRRAVLTAYCWAFVHMCLFGQDRDLRTPLLAFLEAEQKERDKVALMERVFGMKLKALEDTLLRYISRGRYKTQQAKRVVAGVESVAFIPMVPAELSAARLGVQARFLGGSERMDAAIAAYRFLPDGGNEYLCSMASRHCRMSGESELSETLGARAIELGSRNPFVFIDQLASQISVMPMTVSYRMPEEVAAKLRFQVDRALELYPEHRGLISALAYVEAFAPKIRTESLKRIEAAANLESDRGNLLALLAYIRWRHEDAETAIKIITVLKEESSGRLHPLAAEVEAYLKEGRPWRPVL